MLHKNRSSFGFVDVAVFRSFSSRPSSVVLFLTMQLCECSPTLTVLYPFFDRLKLHSLCSALSFHVFRDFMDKSLDVGLLCHVTCEGRLDPFSI